MAVARLYLALDIPPDNGHSFIATSYKLTSLWYLLPVVKRRTIPYFKEFEYLPISSHDEIDRFESVSRQPAPIHSEYITWRYTYQITHKKFKAEAQNVFNSEKTSTNFVHLRTSLSLLIIWVGFFLGGVFFSVFEVFVCFFWCFNFAVHFSIRLPNDTCDFCFYVDSYELVTSFRWFK